jgi:hypothetical protein
MSKVIVPQSDLDRLEQARKDLWNILDLAPLTGFHISSILFSVTSVMWLVANKKYPIYNEDKNVT